MDLISTLDIKTLVEIKDSNNALILSVYLCFNCEWIDL